MNNIIFRNIKINLFVFPILSVLVLFTFRDLFLVFFQQDEWFGFGQAIFLRASKFSQLLALFGGFHFTPFSFLSYAVMYYIFGLLAPAYAAISILLHLIASLLVYFLTDLLLKNKKVATLAAILFAVSNTHQQQVTWYGTSLMGIPAAIFGISSALFFFLSMQRRQQRYFYISLLLLIIGLGFREEIIGLFLFYMLVIVFFYKTQIRKITWLLLSGAIYFMGRAIVQLSQPKSALFASSTPFDYLMNVMERMILFPLKGFSQTVFPPTAMLDFSHVLLRINEPLFMRWSPVRSSGLFTEQYIVPILAILSSIILLLLIFRLLKTMLGPVRKRIILLLLLTICAFLPLAFLPKYAPFESRHFYFPMVGSSILFSYIAYLLISRLHTPLLKAVALGLIVFYVFYNIQLTQRHLRFLVDVSKHRVTLIRQITETYHNLPRQTIFYATGDPLPLQSGPGQILMVLFSDQQPYAGLLGQNALWDTNNGYEEANSIGFGFYYEFQKMLDVYQQHRLRPENVYSFSWDNGDDLLVDTTDTVRRIVP